MRRINRYVMKETPNFSGYWITPFGQVWSDKTGKFLSPWKSGNYLYVGLGKKKRAIHRLVLETFKGRCPAGMECCHNDGNSLNNNLDNLRWDTRSANLRDEYKHGRKSSIPCGENHPDSKLTEVKVREIIYLYRTKLFSQRKIAKLFNVSRSTIQNILDRKTWKHIWRTNNGTT